MPTPADLIAAVNADDASAVERLLVDEPALVSARDDRGVSAILLSRYRFANDVTAALLASGPDLDVFEAAVLGDDERLRSLLGDDSALASAVTADGFTALHLAAFFGQLEAARILLESGASPEAWSRNDFANQPLHASAAGRHLEVCRLLLAAGADVNATQHGGYAPLHEAALHGDAAMVELFLWAGADTTALAEDGRDAATIAEAAGHLDVAARIRELRGDVEADRSPQ